VQHHRSASVQRRLQPFVGVSHGCPAFP
jgi:hypothetical protein